MAPLNPRQQEIQLTHFPHTQSVLMRTCGYQYPGRTLPSALRSALIHISKPPVCPSDTPPRSRVCILRPRYRTLAHFTTSKQALLLGPVFLLLLLSSVLGAGCFIGVASRGFALSLTFLYGRRSRRQAAPAMANRHRGGRLGAVQASGVWAGKPPLRWQYAAALVRPSPETR